MPPPKLGIRGAIGLVFLFPYVTLSRVLYILPENCLKVQIGDIATSNSTERLNKPLLSRFTVFEIPSYTYEEFEEIA
jgi:hypothetical protein